MPPTKSFIISECALCMVLVKFVNTKGIFIEILESQIVIIANKSRINYFD
jgi:hypothetical protein